jgi:peroxiredoxin
MAEKDFATLPAGLPVPEDDGAADHLTGMPVPAVELATHDGGTVDLAAAGRGLLVVYLYPRTGVPGEPLIEGWDDIPGARGCTPQACSFRDLHDQLDATGASLLGVSTQTVEQQREFHDRVNLRYPLAGDPELRLGAALRLPTFEAAGLTLYKRLTFIARGGSIEKVFYPVFPPDRNATDVLAWLNR